MELNAEQMQSIWSVAVSYGAKALIALLIYFVGTTIAKVAGDGVQRAFMTQKDMDPSVAQFAARSVRWLGLILVLAFVLNVFGINTTSIAAMLGAMTLAIGLALRDTLANVAAGIMILMMKPFRTGHTVEIGDMTGKVMSINLFNTEIASFDNVQILVPNKDVWQSAIKNFSVYEKRRMDTMIGVDYGADLGQATAIIRQLIESDPRTIVEPEPFVRVTELDESSVNISLRVWCLASDVHELRFDLTRAIKERFDGAGISIPYPHREIVYKQIADLTADGAGSATTDGGTRAPA